MASSPVSCSSRPRRPCSTPCGSWGPEVRRSILSSLRAHMGRLIAACLAIVLGVGFGTLALTAHASASNGIDETIGAQYRGVDSVVYPENAEITPAELA